MKKRLVQRVLWTSALLSVAVLAASAAGEHDVASGHPVAIAEKTTSLSEWPYNLNEGDTILPNLGYAWQVLPYAIDVPQFIPKDYKLMQVKVRKYYILEIEYRKFLNSETMTGDFVSVTQKKWINKDIIYRMGLSADDVLSDMNYNPHAEGDRTWTYTSSKGYIVTLEGDDKQKMVRRAYWMHDDRAYMFFFKQTMIQQDVENLIDHVGAMKDIALDRYDLLGAPMRPNLDAKPKVTLFRDLKDVIKPVEKLY